MRLAALTILGVSIGLGWAGQSTMTPFVPPTRCEPPAARTKSAIGIPEAQGRATNASIWALFFHPLTANRRVKIAWKMTGTGKFTVSAYSPIGQRSDPVSGPDPHGSSNWIHEGDEWGTWFEFPTPGCWDLHAARDGSSGDLWIEVK